MHGSSIIGAHEDMDILVAAAANAATTIAAASMGATPRAAIFYDAGVCNAHHDVILQRFLYPSDVHA
jgi:hypothetical protein